MSPGIPEYNKNKNDVICPAACGTAKCIHGLNITKCHFCVNRFSLKNPTLLQNISTKSSSCRILCEILCRNYNCTAPNYCKKHYNIDKGNLDKCPTDCQEALCLKRAMKDQKGEIPRELVPCICNSAELEEFAAGPVNSFGYSTCVRRKKDSSETEFPISRAVSKVLERGDFEVILREPVCERHWGWDKTFTKSKHLDGSIYAGTKNELGFAGKGQLRLPHGVTYDGEFDQGRFHGKGTLTYPTGVSVEGIWDKGKNLSINWIRFADGLKYMQPEWTYMSPPERRFYPEYTEGLQADCSLYRTGQSPSPDLPSGTYDTGDGYYCPKRKCIYDFKTNESIRIPCSNEVKWIKNNCRFGWRETIGNKIVR